MSTDNDATITALYDAFGRRDGDAMAARYAPEARFSDPVFGELVGDRVTGMWRMLTAQAKDLRIELPEHAAAGDRGTARWIARYTFSRTGRPVVNDVRARFRFDGEGRIVEHDDTFPIWTWTRQALGLPGLLLGWTPALRKKVRQQSLAALDAYQAGRSAG